ncbi:PREDICTED: rab-3A-interacting protein-like [Priapulus caudatus]|uniref:Rab-3A-interacting protein-like n=1 Tax=Priapulus caudatus TaxID=37621 RepID=A0ABM1EK86_PRICU|nr:PREDICTED: rab-3A-interacting protein-like [Priapulus caudatus]
MAEGPGQNHILDGKGESETDAHSHRDQTTVVDHNKNIDRKGATSPLRTRHQSLEDDIYDERNMLGRTTSTIVHRRPRSMSMAEVVEIGYLRLQQELKKAQQELSLKDEEVDKLSRVRDEIGLELQDLTASLFEEAHNMVREANEKQALAEKKRKEASSKIEVLEAEVNALKVLVITSTPSMPNPDMHPQINTKNKGNKANFLRGHKRSTSHCDASMKRELALSPPAISQTLVVVKDHIQIDPALYQEFADWKENPQIDHHNPFLARIYAEDIIPCLTYCNTELAKDVEECVESNTLTIEAVPTDIHGPRKCALTQDSRICGYRMKVGDLTSWHSISQLARDRIAAVCNFFTYVRYINQGLVKNEDKDIYCQIVQLRKQMALAKLGIGSQ